MRGRACQSMQILDSFLVDDVKTVFLWSDTGTLFGLCAILSILKSKDFIEDLRSATNDTDFSWLAQGHELGLHVLYQLYADHACTDVDQPTSTSAAYDQFLLSLVC